MAVTISDRERRTMRILVVLLPSVLLVVGLVASQIAIGRRRSEIESLIEARTTVEDARTRVAEAKARKQQLAQRYGSKAPSLSGYLDQEARAEKLDVADHADRPEGKVGKRFSERHHVMHVRKAGMRPVAMFLERIAKSPYPLSVSRLLIAKRGSEPDSYDVEFGVSAYDRTETAEKKDKP
jgi:general secretion pathway protein M